MNMHRIIGGVLMVLFLAAAEPFGHEARATSFSTDQSDLWWNPSESGWGMQVVQTGSVIFVTMFVYDQNTNPIWYTATGNYMGNSVWTGDLIQTRGPWYGTVPFNPGSVTSTKVGTLTFDSSGPNGGTRATVTYSINGVVITKAIQRQTLTFDNFGGTYQGMFKQVLTCSDPTQNGTVGVPVILTIAHAADAAFTLISGNQEVTCIYTGTYGQDGRFGNVSGVNYSCSDGIVGTAQFFEMYVNTIGFSSRGAFQNQDCSATFDLGGVRQ